MIKIAICDDNVEMGQRIEAEVKQLLAAKQRICEEQVFCDGKYLWYEIQDGAHFDLILLDIEMPEMDGISLANLIKMHLPNCLIIFITSHDRYVYDSFKVQPFRFIPKQFLEERLAEAVLDAVIWIEKNACRYYQAENQQGLERIPIGEILYIWHSGKYAYIERLNGEYVKVRKPLKQVYGELPDGDFTWLEKGSICNLAQIRKVTGSEVILMNGNSLKVSRDRLTEVKAQIRRYWTNPEDK